MGMTLGYLLVWDDPTALLVLLTKETAGTGLSGCGINTIIGHKLD